MSSSSSRATPSIRGAAPTAPDLARHGRVLRATLRKDLILRVTYPTWMLNRLISPVAGIAIAIFSYTGVASFGSIKQAFASTGASPNFIAFLVVGQVVFNFFLGLNYRAGLAIQRERWYGTLEILLLAPMNRMTWLASEAIWGVIDTGWPLVIALVVAAFLFQVSFHLVHPLVALLAFLLTLGAMMGLGIFFAGFYILSRSAGPLSNSVAAPMQFFSGSRFPVAVLPAALQAVSYAVPVTWGLLAMRDTLLEGAGLGAVWRSFVVLAVFTVVLVVAGRYLVGVMERQAKRGGTLHYY